MRLFAPRDPRRPALLVLAALLICLPVYAQDPPDNVEYDLIRHHDSLTAWLNLARYFGDPELQALSDGIGFACRIDLALSHPRKLWGSTPVATASREFLVSYNLPARSYRLTLPDTTQPDHLFQLPDDLLTYLADSILIPICPIDSLPIGRNYRLSLDISRISLTGINLAADNQSDNPSAIRLLFREFLRLTGYGRDQWKTTSRTFRLAEITPRPH